MLVKLFKVFNTEEIGISELQKVSSEFAQITYEFTGTSMKELIPYLQNTVDECNDAIPPRLNIEKIKDEKPIERNVVVYTLNSKNIFGFTTADAGIINHKGELTHHILVEWFITSNVKERITEAESYHWNMIVMDRHLSDSFESISNDEVNYINNMPRYAV